MNLVTCLKIDFKNCTLKICDIYLNSKYFANQILSQDSRNSGEFLWYIIFWKNFFKLGLTSKNERLSKMANINQWDCELRATNEILLVEKHQWTLFSSILSKHYYILMILEVSNKNHCELNKILRNFCVQDNLWFSVVFEYYASICNVPVLIHK